MGPRPRKRLENPEIFNGRASENRKPTRGVPHECLEFDARLRMGLEASHGCGVVRREQRRPNETVDAWHVERKLLSKAASLPHGSHRLIVERCSVEPETLSLRGLGRS
jgi:hypothetical protein